VNRYLGIPNKTRKSKNDSETTMTARIRQFMTQHPVLKQFNWRPDPLEKTSWNRGWLDCRPGFDPMPRLTLPLTVPDQSP